MVTGGRPGSPETDPLVSATVSKSIGEGTVERVLRRRRVKAISFWGALKIPVSESWWRRGSTFASHRYGPGSTPTPGRTPPPTFWGTLKIPLRATFF